MSTFTCAEHEAPLLAMHNGFHCCLLCLRQFKSADHLRRHLDHSAIHAANAVKEARAAGATAKRAAPSMTHPDPQSGEAPSDVSSGGGSGAAGMSALEQMQLFEKRLKVQARRGPDKAGEPAEEACVDSNRARTMNGQMDWECSGCGHFNFARVVVCVQCKKHVDSSTKYISNRLKTIKHERFARVFANDAEFSRHVQQPEQQPDGSFGLKM